MSLRVQNVNFRGGIVGFKSHAGQLSRTTYTGDNKEDTVKSKLSPIEIASAGLALVSLGVAAVSISKSAKMTNIEKNLNNRLSTISNSLEDAINKNTTLEEKLAETTKSLTEAVSDSKKVAEELGSVRKFHDEWLKAHDSRIETALNIQRANITPSVRNLAPIDRFLLLQNLENNGTRIKLSEGTKEWIQNAARRFINNGSDGIPIKKLTPKSTVWSLTAESIPEKEGGLGEVPVQISKNMLKELEINNPMVRPMSLIPGKSKFVEASGKYTYIYDLDKPKKYEIDLEKVAEFKTKAFRNGIYDEETVEVFTGIDPANGYKRIMFKNDKYFTSKSLYSGTTEVSETERYAFYAKAAYEFAKIKEDPNSITSLIIYNKAAFDEIQPADAIILNDWHAGGFAALARFKSACEADNNELSKAVSEKFKTMTIINIDHNLNYQGKDYPHSSEILNTLFDKYAFDIYENAKTGFGHRGIENVLVTDGQVNLANMAGCLSNKMKPVSPTYARELAEQSERSGDMQHLCQVRIEHGTMEGASNGWDRAVNEVSNEKLGGFLNAINGDKIKIFQAEINNISGLDASIKKQVHEILEKKLDASTLKVRVEELKRLNSPSITQKLAELADNGTLSLRSIKPATYADTTDTIMSARRHNKAEFLKYLNSIIAHDKNKKDGMFGIAEPALTDLSHVRVEDLDDTIFFNMGVRFVSQKGVDIACESIKKVLGEWSTKYPTRKLPVFVIGGADGENGAIKPIAYRLKKELGADLSKQVVYMDGYTPNNIFQSCTDYTLYSSWFEPDGAKWESLYKGTPVICTRVGGHVDSVKDGINGFLTTRTLPEIDKSGRDRLAEISSDFTNAIYRAVDTFYEKEKYANMVRNSIDGNQSWVIKNEKGEIVGGALLGHMKDLGFNLADFPQIKLPTAAST